MRHLKSLQWVLMISCCLFLLSCAPPPETSRMVPHLDYASYKNTGYSLKISPVGGADEKPNSISRIDNERLFEALTETLTRSNLFTNLNKSDSYDYELRTQIISQKLKPGMTAYAALYVSYALVDSKNDHIVWQETIFTQNDAFGANQGKDALEGVARINLEQLVEKLVVLFEKI